ncbi:MAG: putative quinol monooxygenase [Thiogranum sp.]
MANLTIVAKITAKVDKNDLVKAQLEKLIDITRAEEGCLQYDSHQDNENPAHFMFYENWESRELWQIHMGNQHNCEAVNWEDTRLKTTCTTFLTSTAVL